MLVQEGFKPIQIVLMQQISQKYLSHVNLKNEVKGKPQIDNLNNEPQIKAFIVEFEKTIAEQLVEE